MLSGLLKKEAQENKIHGIQVSRKAPVIINLFFAYDNLLFTRANSLETDSIMAILQKYELSS